MGLVGLSGPEIELDPHDDRQPVTDSDIAPLGVPTGLTHEESLLTELLGVALEVGVEGRPGHCVILANGRWSGKSPLHYLKDMI